MSTEWKDTLCSICSVRFGVCRDGKTCSRHTSEQQETFSVEHKEKLRAGKLGRREKYNSEENQARVAGWRQGLEKMKEARR